MAAIDQDLDDGHDADKPPGWSADTDHPVHPAAPGEPVPPEMAGVSGARDTSVL